MPGSPRRIYRNLTDAQLLQLQASFFERTVNGSFTSLSGQGHSSQTEFGDLEDQQFELAFEMGVRGLGVANPPQIVYQQMYPQIPTSGNINVP